jgi:cobalt-zinc-cadmium efflux system membrane fusion protein
LFVLAALGGLAYWGHHTGWTLPKFSDLSGTGAAEPDDWCKEHGVPESECVECNPELMPKGKTFGWCKTHGVSDCPHEHPEVAEVRPTPKVTEADLARAERALAFAERPENSSKCKLHVRRIQFASKEAFEKTGVEVAPVWRAPVVEAVTANGEVLYDQTGVARLSARVPGTVWWVPKQVGEPVKRGEVLALVDAVEVGRAKAELVQAIANLNLKTRIFANLRSASGAVPERQIQEAEAAQNEAQVRLHTAQQALMNLGLAVELDDVKDLRAEELTRRVRFLGLPEKVIKTLETKATTANLLPVVAPLDGVVVSREVVAGEVVDSTKVLFVVADVSRMWLTLSVRLEDARLIALGQPVRFRPDGGREEVSGKVTWKSTSVDERTRTVKVRADLDNPEARLHANAFGTGRVILREEKDAIVVPNESVHWEGCCHIVFVRDKDFLEEGAPKVFHVRKIRPGAKDEKQTEVIAGVLPGEVVATRGSGVLRAELLKNNLGAG